MGARADFLKKMQRRRHGIAGRKGPAIRRGLELINENLRAEQTSSGARGGGGEILKKERRG